MSATTVRKSPGATREELDVIVAQVNALVADQASYAVLGDNVLVGMDADTAIVADLTAIRVTLAALVVDVAALITAHNTLATKLNNDATVTDTDYAAASAQTSTTPAAITAVAPTSTNAVTQGGTAGKIKLAVDAEFEIAGVRYEKAPTDDLWDLSALATLSGTAYRATALYLNSSGTASIASGATATTAAAAIANLEAIPATKSRIAVYVAAPSTVYTNALNAQGTYYIGRPAAFVPTAGGITLIAP